MHGDKLSAVTQRVLSLEERSSTEQGASAHEVPAKGECQAAQGGAASSCPSEASTSWDVDKAAGWVRSERTCV